jgi:peptide-methionine (R)-S-oxide reductase
MQIDKSDEEWKKELTQEQYHVCREGGTEPAFSGKYYNSHKQGIYLCACCKQKLFSSTQKFDSGTGWPSFFDQIDKNAITTLTDTSHNMVRTEIRCAKCGSHLGHLFPDGPAPTHMRYCVNSLSLDFQEED